MSLLARNTVKAATGTLHAATRRSMATAPLLVSPKEVQGASDTPRVFLDASWHMPNSPRKAREEFVARRIPGARFLDLDEVASAHELGLKHMMPSGDVFARACERLGIERSSHVVIYDTHGIFSSPRALFMFRAFGHTNSSVLNGGLLRWISEGYAVENSAPAEVQPTQYPTPALDASLLRDYDQIVLNSKVSPSANGASELVVDARARGRWLGSDPEPRPGLSSGHIPHSFSIPFNNFVQSHEVPGSSDKFTTLRSPEELETEVLDVLGPEFTRQAHAGERTVVTSCGSGMTAGVLWLGLKTMGVEKIGLYDESWTGYAMRKDSVVEKAITN